MTDIERCFDRLRRGVWVGSCAAKEYVEWNDLSRVLVRLVEWTKQEESRQKFDEVMYNSLKDLLVTAKSDVERKVNTLTTLTQTDVDAVTVTIIATANIIRLLRNSVVNIPCNQFLQVKTGLLDVILDCICFYHQVTEKCHRVKHKHPYALTYSPLCIEVIRASLQAAANLCVGNHAVQGAVWHRLFPKMLGILLDSVDKHVKNYTCCVMFYCTAWSGSMALDELFNDDNGHAIIRKSIKLCDAQHSLEWAQLFIEGLMCVERFIPLYEICESDETLIFTVLEILSEKISSAPRGKKKELFGELESALPVTTFLYLAKLIARNKQLLISMAVGNEEGVSGEVTARILQIIVDVTALQEQFDRIAKNTPFLECIVKMLNEINTKKPIRWDNPKTEVKPNIEFGIRRDLIRVICNMSSGNKVHQEKVRVLGGMETILNHCVVDKQNPYLQQWSIVAIKMLTDNNLENQDIIRKLKSQGIVHDDELKKLGIEVRIENEKPRASIIHPEPEQEE